MIHNRKEFQRMFEVEQKLWWYKTLHGKVLTQLTKHFSGFKPEVRILDAACGTGGLLTFLREKGYKNLTGFDYSEHAISLSADRNLNVSFGDLRNVDSFRPAEKFDVIICNDALYFLTDDEIIDALKSFRKRLNPNGLIVVNIHAFEAFSGTHDIAVGSSRRFELKDFFGYAFSSDLKITYNTYWPFALSLPILAVRQWQRYKIKKDGITTEHTESDVSYPGDTVNNLLLGILKIEEKLLPRSPFGSSLFMTFR